MRVNQARPRYAVGLTRVSTAEQGQSGLGLDAQIASVRAFVAAQGWTLVAESSDVASGMTDRRPGFQAALARCRQLGAVLVAARLDRITRRAHTLSQQLEEGYAIWAADMLGADDLMMRIYAAMAQKERELISERTRAALAAAKARGKVLGGDRGYRPVAGPCSRRGGRTSRGGRAGRTARGAGTRRAAGLGHHRPRRPGPCAHRARRADPARWNRVDPHHRRAGAGKGGLLNASIRPPSPRMLSSFACRY